MLKRVVTCKQLAKNDTRGPDIRFLGVVERIVFSSIEVLLNNLWGVVVVGPLDRFQSC